MGFVSQSLHRGVRKAERPLAHLAGFTGVLQVDGYEGYRALTKGGAVRRAGNVVIVRYADDIVVGFEREADARRFQDAMRERLAAFALSLHPDKTRLLEFAASRAEPPAARLGKPNTFAFLGFIFICVKAARVASWFTEEPWRPHEGDAEGREGRAAAPDASADLPPGAMAEAGRHGVLQLPRRADQQ